MKFVLLLLLCLGATLAPAQELSATDAWKLSWRMYMSKIEKNYELGERQFDSLRATKSRIDKKLMLTGLEIVNQRNDIAKVSEILKELDVETLEYLCGKNFIHKDSPDYVHCRSFNTEVSHPELELDIIKMFVNDQMVRGANMESILNRYNLKKEAVVKGLDMPATDLENRTRLKEILSKHGFPTKKMVGAEAMNAIFLIIQHSDRDKSWQRSQLPNIELAVKNGDMDGQSYAYLYDRIKLGAGEKQLYGTQFTSLDPKTNQIELGPTEDPGNLDKRRMEVGMMPIDAYKRLALISSRK
ncbi:DUF6624 domain-containing protein [Daejeonella lutea]|uniref:Uncharacterized protein n=1 Tax=Daejeonella lutea TaxID=572036 RepID=A0A1T5ET27_9SPHI|nr:DUF6624 domain-containing protein [Daejeonella lutea]SKB87103.1 hypothetical protein SAMN05661099_3193 [Daejeonella lutea]